MSHVRLVIHFNGNVYSPLRIVNYHDYNNVISIYKSAASIVKVKQKGIYTLTIFSHLLDASKVASSTLSFMDSKFESYFLEGIYFVGF